MITLKSAFCLYRTNYFFFLLKPFAILSRKTLHPKLALDPEHRADIAAECLFTAERQLYGT